jgi:hypothetical protein
MALIIVDVKPTVQAAHMATQSTIHEATQAAVNVAACMPRAACVAPSLAPKSLAPKKAMTADSTKDKTVTRSQCENSRVSNNGNNLPNTINCAAPNHAADHANICATKGRQNSKAPCNQSIDHGQLAPGLKDSPSML